MTENKTPSEAALREACRRLNWRGSTVEDILETSGMFKSVVAFAAMIEKYEPETLVDPDLIRARELYAEEFGFPSTAVSPNARAVQPIFRAIKETRAEYEK